MQRAVVALLALFLAATLQAITDDALLKRADAYLAKGNKSSIFRAYNDYKSLYLRCVIAENETCKLRALRGIIRSGKRLHIDVSVYQRELIALLKQQKIQKKQKKARAKRDKKRKKRLKLTAANSLERIYQSRGRIILRFKQRLQSRRVNHFKLYNAKKNEYKYIFDIEAKLPTGSKTIKKAGIRRIKVAQFKPNIVRLVIANDSLLRVRFKISGQELVVNVRPLRSQSKKQPSRVHKLKRVEPKRALTKKRIVIDPGHGGKDPGASGYRGYKEKDVVLSIASYVRDYLKKRGYDVLMTRSGDYFISLRRRTRFANQKKADLFISIHANASKNKRAKGVETYFLSPTRSKRAKRVAAMENRADIDDMNYYAKQSFLSFLNNHKIIASNKLAIDLQQGMLLELRKHYRGVVDGGVREGPFWVLVGAQMPAVLIEVGFITNPSEGRRLGSKRYQRRLAKGIADGVVRYFMKN